MSTEAKPTEEYIANCFFHILKAECLPSKLRDRDCDIAHVVTIAANEGEQAAHRYLISLAECAQNGKYAA